MCVSLRFLSAQHYTWYLPIELSGARTQNRLTSYPGGQLGEVSLLREGIEQ